MGLHLTLRYEKGWNNELCYLVSDVDECSNNLHKCNLTASTCVNKPGNYSCQCKEGYGQTDGINCLGNETKKMSKAFSKQFWLRLGYRRRNSSFLKTMTILENILTEKWTKLKQSYRMTWTLASRFFKGGLGPEGRKGKKFVSLWNLGAYCKNK